jgi:hypothetical protein
MFAVCSYYYNLRRHATMSSQPTPTPTLPLDAAAVVAMQSATIDTMPSRPGATEAQKAARRAGAIDFLAALHPRDLMEATLATRIVSVHYAAMECLHRAAQDNLPMDLHLRTVGKAVALLRMMDGTMNELWRRQARRTVQPVVLPASGVAPQAQAAAEVVPASTPVQPAVMEGRHERRRRERAERHLASAAHAAGLPKGALENAMQQRARAVAAARAAAPATAVAA